ncbi:MAG TPA: transcriptional regulator [Rhodothermales bacterium]|nr:transcriptional regulator [Rhodothermales bacterium]
MPRAALLSSETKQKLLLLVKRRGCISLDDAEAATGLTRTTLREHFGHFERDGLVRRYTKKQGRGRPSLRYELTEQGQALFPSHDGVLLRRLLGFIEAEGKPELVERFFETFWEARLDDARRRLRTVDRHDRAGQIRIVEELLREQGFMPEVDVTDDGFAVRECNCPFPEAVKQTRLPCRLEAKFFEQLFDAPSTRVTYIPEGSPACTYEFCSHDRAA